MSKIHTIFVLAVLSVVSGCAPTTTLRSSCAPTTSAAAADGDSAARGPLWPLAQCACLGKLDREMVSEAVWPFPPPHLPGNHVQYFWDRTQLHMMFISQDQCADGRPVEGAPIVLTLFSNYKFSTSPEGDLLAAWRSFSTSTGPKHGSQQWHLAPIDVTNAWIRAAFEAEKSQWLAEIGQSSTGLPPAPVPPSP